MTIVRKFAFILFCSWLLSCGSGNDGGGGGIGGTGSAQGPATAKGSVTVNGVKFITDRATVVVQGQTQATPGDLASIEVGMTLALQGRFDSATSGEATRVEYRSSLIGRITAINRVDSSFTAMGQTVSVDGDVNIGTIFAGLPNKLADLAVGDAVEVSGAANGSGLLVASFVRRTNALAANGASSSLAGNVSAINSSATTFRIGGLPIKYDPNGGTAFKNLIVGDLTAAPYVEVKGSVFDANGALIATSIELVSRGLDLAPNRRLEIQGLVSDCVAPCRGFALERQAIVTTDQTKFINGQTADLIDGRKIEAQGTIDANGTLLASQIKFIKGSVEIDSFPDSAANSTTLTFPMLGISVKVNAQTQSGSGLSPAGIGSARLRVKGYRIGDRAIIATRIDSGDSAAANDALLRGPLSDASKASSQLAIIALPVTVDRATEFRDSSTGTASPIGLDGFFDLTQTGSIVKVKGLRSGTAQIDARGAARGSVEIESAP